MSQGSITARRIGDGAGIRIDWRDGRIAALTPAAAPDDVWLAPTLFEGQVNGFAGVDFGQDDLPRAELERAIAALRAEACGEMLLTVVTAPWEQILAKLRRLRAMRAESPALTRAIAGWHVEGPFMSSVAGYCGAHNPAWMLDPTPALIRQLREAAGDLPLLLTLAPERAGAIKSIREATALGMVVSLGHTNASSADIAAAIAAGARSFTHLGNGIPQQLDRHDNLLWRVLDAPRGLNLGLVTDGAHVAPMLFRLLDRLGVDCWYTTDAVALAGLPVGRHRMWGKELDVCPDGAVREPGKPFLSGSATPPLRGALRAARMLGRPWRDAWKRYADSPRRMMGVPEPIAVGRPADFCLVRGGDAVRSVTVYGDGREIARHDPPVV